MKGMLRRRAYKNEIIHISGTGDEIQARYPLRHVVCQFMLQRFLPDTRSVQ